jgi:hypothetical protein
MYPIIQKSNYVEPYLNENLEDIEGEEWRDVPMYDGMLFASNFGRIKRAGYYDSREKYRKEKIIKQTIKKGDINFLAITYNKKTYTMLQMVGLAFFGYLKDGYCFQRKDYNQYNCKSDNILILTIKQSRQRMYDVGANINSEHAKSAIKTSKYIFKRLNDGKEFLTAELKNEYPKKAFIKIKAAVKKNKMLYGTYWEQRLKIAP